MFSCYVNASDVDELNNLTFTTNYTWFTFNGTGTNYSTLTTNGTGNASALLNFTPTDLHVGNWSINLTVIDTGAQDAPIELNSTTFYFYIANVNDSVVLQNIPDMSNVFTSQNYSILINATDNDLLVPHKTIMNETLTFTTNSSYMTVSNQLYFSGTNRSQVTLSFNPNDFGVGLHSINVTVHDRYNNSLDSDVFTIDVVDNSAPQWNSTMATNFNLTENVQFYLNLSQNVTDSDPINFSLTLLDSYGFSINIGLTTGIINFTPNDTDVGLHQVRITATDGKTPQTKDLNFTVSNIPDVPAFLALPLQNGTLSNGLINVTEDTQTVMFLQITDDDLYIEQTSYYSESFNLSLNITGPNSTLFQFNLGEEVINNIYQFRSVFTPRKADVGNYNLTMNITDASGNSTLVRFNLTVTETAHPPNITTPIANRELSILNENFYIDVNSSDIEDGSDGVNGNLTFRIQNLTTRGNFLLVNSTTGIINFTSNSSLAGVWRFRLIVNDTDGQEDSEDFNLTIYDYPVVLLPNSTYTFSFIENTSVILNFTVNHSVQDDLNYTLIINGIIKNSTTGYGNATDFLWGFTPNFTMETTCSGAVNLALNISNSKLSNVTTWLVTINHTNYPLSFITTIPDQSGGTPLLLTLSNYFYDVDASDPCLNQTIGFVYTQLNDSATGGTITVDILNWSGNGTSPRATFSTEAAGSANFSFTAFEYNVSNSSQLLTNLTSNNFSVSLTVSEATSTPQTGGGGGSTRTQIISLKILVPEPVSAKQKDKLIIPLGLENDGEVTLKRIYLDATIAKDGAIRSDLVASFDQSYFETLAVDARENITMVVDIDTNSVGLFEVTINATVEDPEYEDWAKFYIEIEEDRSVLEKIIFTEEFVIGNPQCAELIDLVNDAKQLYSEGKEDEAVKKAEEALNACNKAITQPPRPRIYERLGDKFIGFTAIFSLIAFALGFAYYTYKKISLRRQLNTNLGKI